MKRAFSLVELSIVLVILGLLVGGILSGQSLIRAAELRAVTTELNKYMTATRAFRDKYFAFAGDMNNAETFWGTAAACPGNNSNTTSPGKATCNGDGDGMIQTGNGTLPNETFRYWQELANAGLIEGIYTGVSNNPSSVTVVDSVDTPNVPKSKINNAHWAIRYLGKVDINDPDYFEGNYGNTFRLGTGVIGTNKIIKPEEAWNIDTKIDDSKPGTGQVVSVKWQAESTASIACTSPAATNAVGFAASSTYFLTNTGNYCSLIFNINL